MTETEWLTATDPQPMLMLLAGRVSDRQLRLFAFRCWDEQFGGDRAQHAEAAEEFAAGRIDGSVFALVLRSGRAIHWQADAMGVASHLSSLAAGEGLYPSLSAEERARRCEWLREMFGNPFRPVVIDPSWVTSTVVALARGIEVDSAADRLPILADALEDAGCDDPNVLLSLRTEQRHSGSVGGHQVLDLLLGRGGWRASVGEPRWTESDWQASADPWGMLDFVSPRTPLLRLREFARACCRRMPDLTSHARAAVELDEAFRRGVITTAEWTSRRAAARVAAERMIPAEKSRFEQWEADRARRWEETPSRNKHYAGVTNLREQCHHEALLHQTRAVVALLADDFPAVAAEAAAAVVASHEAQCWEDMVQTDTFFAMAEERRQQAALLRELVADPFRPGV